MESDQRKSLRNIITREMIANTLIHREFTSAYQAKFVIENDRMYVENANRSAQSGAITPENIEPNPKIRSLYHFSVTLDMRTSSAPA